MNRRLRYIRRVLAILLITIFGSSFGQTALDLVHWEFSKETNSDGTINLVATASIEEGWHIYPQSVPGMQFPPVTKFSFNSVSGCELVDSVLEIGDLHTYYDTILKEDQAYYENKVQFVQKIKVENGWSVSGELEFFVCKEVCKPPEIVEFKYEPEPKTDDVSDIGSEDEEENGLWTVFFMGFGYGLIAFLTPCVFPMVPITVSFFTKGSESRAKGIRKAIIYSISIVVIYVSLGAGLTAIFGYDVLNLIATNPAVNIVLFSIFIVFAISFFGAFELTLPASWANKTDKLSERGGFIGIFFMAVTLVIVSFSCTGLLMGSLVVQIATEGDLLVPITAMTGFGIALGLPFGLFAIFPAFMKALPKSGGWLNSVKVVLGFLELAVALKFLSVADQVMHWGILDREIFILFWIVIFAFIGFYLLGKIRFKSDSPLEHASIARVLLSIGCFSFCIYLLPGMIGAPLKMMSGFFPPMTTQDFVLGQYQVNANTISLNSDSSIVKKGGKDLHCPHNLNCYFDYEQALEVAKKENKPLLIDFTGHGCVNCRRMEAYVWSDKQVLNRIANDFILVSLYVDDRNELPREEQYTTTEGKEVTTRGQKWTQFQVKHYKRNSQPFYVLAGHSSMKPLVKPVAYDTDIEKYIKFLDAGKKAFLSSQ